MFIRLTFFLSVAFLSLPSVGLENETIPDDIRYMLEDMYGENKKEWPSPRYKKDLNNDGFSDWVAIKKRLFTERKVRSRNF